MKILAGLGHDSAILVTEMLSASPELLVGTTRTADGDVLVTVAIGGTAVEIIDDAAVRRAPVSPATGTRMLAELHLGRMLDGQRGLPSVNRGELAQLISTLSSFAFEWRNKILEIDINP